MFSIFNTKDHKWRDNFNPLRGLTMPRLVSMLEAGERGQYAELQWFYYFMERSDAMIASVIQRRKAALLSVDWDIRTVAETTNTTNFDKVLAEEQRDFLRMAYDEIENLKDAIAFLSSAIFRGYAHVEKHFGESGLIKRLETVEQWFWVRDGMFGDWEYNQDANSGRLTGEEITRENFVVFETIALNRILSVLYLRKNLSAKDWDSYLAVYGIPSVFLIGPPNASEQKEQEYQRIAEALINDGRGYLPNGSDIKYVNGGGGKAPFMEHLDYLDKQITIAATGGLLTMLAEAGSGTLAGGAHSETFLQLAQADSTLLSSLFQREIDLPLLEDVFPGEPTLAYFEFSPLASEQTQQVVDDAANLADAGIEVDKQELAEKTGYRIEEGGPEA
jgi:phage gp29-like protein